MKQKIKIIFFIAFAMSVLLFTNDTVAQTDDGFLIIRVYQSTDKRYNKIVVTQNGKKLEEIDLIPFYYKEDLAESQIAINNVVDKYKSRNYILDSVTSGAVPSGSAVGTLVTTFLFKDK